MKYYCIIAILCACLMSSGGCIIVTDNTFESDKCGIPKEARKVGGGLEITYIASEDGIINLVDRKSCKNLMSKSVTAGEKFEFFASIHESEKQSKWGIDMKKANIVLYFIPAKPKPPIPVGSVQPPLPPQPPHEPVPPQPAQ